MRGFNRIWRWLRKSAYNTMHSKTLMRQYTESIQGIKPDPFGRFSQRVKDNENV